MEQNESFRFTYSAQQRSEVEAIRNQYLPKEEDKMEQLRRLHGIPARRASTAALIVGVLGALVMGTGMSICMTDIGAAFGAYAMIAGIVIGVAGMIPVALAYPIYNRVLQKEREKLAPQILLLTDELLK